MAFMPNARCLEIAVKAADGKMSQEDIMEAFERIDAERENLRADGRYTDEQLRRFAAEQAEFTRIEAAAERRRIARRILVRDRIETHVAKLTDAGMEPHKAIQALEEGAGGRFSGVSSGRKSTQAQKIAYRNSYLGQGFFAKLEAEKPHLKNVLHSDKQLDGDVYREMWELRDGGTPGSTGNKDAIFVAKTFMDTAEYVRTELNKLGAAIGKFNGWAGVQTHDNLKLIRAGKEKWIGAMVHHYLDVKRSFGPGVSSTQAATILGDIYDTIITGVPNTPTAAQKGRRTNPANWAKALNKQRVLHMRGPDEAIAYNEEFGYGGTIAGMIGHLARSADTAAIMHDWGDNPEVMFTSVVDDLRAKVKANPNLDPATKNRQTELLNVQKGALKSSFRIMTGIANVSENVKWSDIGNSIRATERMAKLGGATITSVPSDAVTTAIAGQFRGSGFLNTLMRQMSGMLQGVPQGERAVRSAIMLHGYEGYIGKILNGAAHDAPLGVLSRLQEAFFRWNGLTYTTDLARSVAGHTLSAEMGAYSHLPYDQLNPRYRHVLGLNDITAPKWEVIRKGALRQSDGQIYLTPDRIEAIPDKAFLPLIEPNRLARAQGKADRVAALVREARRDLQLDVFRFYADEMNFGVITPDAATQRWTTWGGKNPGSFAGEMARYIMQFKGQPIAFVQRTLARAVFGHRRDAKSLERGVHFASILAGLTIAGYMAMTAKDMIAGYWPPRNPLDGRTWQAAALQSGALGIYGDFIFSKVNRFGGGLAETAVGPTIGPGFDFANIAFDARDYATSGGDDPFSRATAFSTAWSNVPYMNLYYVKPVMDWLWVNSFREWLAPGYLRKQAKNRLRDYGQQRLLPMTAAGG